jgi:hypothetical protein
VYITCSKVRACVRFAMQGNPWLKWGLRLSVALDVRYYWTQITAYIPVFVFILILWLVTFWCHVERRKHRHTKGVCLLVEFRIRPRLSEFQSVYFVFWNVHIGGPKSRLNKNVLILLLKKKRKLKKWDENLKIMYDERYRLSINKK